MQYPALPFAHVGARVLRAEMARIWQCRGYQGTIGPCELARRTVEVLFGYGLDTIYSVAHLDGVEIDFHDALFAPEEFNEEREISLEPLSHTRPPWP